MKISLNFPHKNLNFPPNEWPGKKRDEQQQDAHHEDVEARLGGHMGVCTIKRVQKLINCQFESVMPAIISFLLEIEIVAEKPTISNIADHRVCLPCASQIFLMKKLEITSNLSRVVGIGVEVVFVKKNQNFQIQISRNWAYHFFGGFWGPSIYRSWGSILIGLYPSDPRCWRSMHTYIGCFHPKHKFDISHKNWNHKISSCPVYFYCPRYNLNLRK